ncbi:MAG: PA domain-containing protein [Acidimicrobiales bacterium]
MRFRRTIGTAVAATTVALGAVVTTAGPASAAHVGCGAVITTNTTLDSDIGPCPASGLTVTASNTTLNLNGHRVFAANGEGDHAGIILKRVKNVSVKNGTVEGFDAGVLIAQGSGNFVSALTLRDNINDGLGGACNLGDGITIRNSDNNRIVNNQLFHNGPFGGISLVTDSDSNLIKSNHVEDSNVVGVGCGNPNQDEGIRIEGPGANYNRVEDNTVIRGLLAGIGLHGNVGCQTAPPGNPPPGSPNTDNFVVNNKVRLTAGAAAANGIAVLEQGPLGSIVCAAFRNTFTGNTSTDNQGSGIFIGSTSVDNVISANLVNNNGVDGIYLGGPFGIDVFTDIGPTLLDLVVPDQPTFVAGTDYRALNGSGSGDVTAPLVAVGAINLTQPIGFDSATSGCDPADFIGFPDGAVALIQRGFCARDLKVQNAIDAGASAVILFNEGSLGRTGLVIAGVGQKPIPVVDATFATGQALYNLTQSEPEVIVHVVTNTIYSVFPASGAENNTLYNNRGTGNAEHDGHDDNPRCDNNDWVANKFGTVNRICVTANGGAGVVT